ncbi:Alcohol dehydrogenase-related 31 kDa protein [Gryllus bimaculatus]|nr:Alcohol dehydrogenase-related 31 kDa protein [Gryllus bimaculatus]
MGAIRGTMEALGQARGRHWRGGRQRCLHPGAQRAGIVENVAKGILHVIEHGASGSVWVCENYEPAFEVAVPEYRKIHITS